MSSVAKNHDERYASYSANSLNQYTSRTVPGYVNVLGTATNTATVSLWSKESTALYTATTRKGDYFRGEMPFNNATGAMWLTITNVAVLSNYTSADIVTNVLGNLLLAKTPEAFLYDADGSPREITQLQSKRQPQEVSCRNGVAKSSPVSHGEILTNDSLWSYTWDAENRLVKPESVSSLATAGKRRLEFAYDYQSRRIQKLVSTNNGSYVAQSTNRFVYPVRYDYALLLCLCPPKREGWAILYRLHSRFAGKGKAAPSRRSRFHAQPWAAKVDLLRGMSQSERCYAPGAIPENGLGQTLPQEPAEKLSHGVNDGWNLVATLNPQSAILQSFTWGLDLSGSLQGAGGVGGLLMLTDQTTINNQPSTHFAAYDGNGNVAALVAAASGTVSATYEYGPFSEVVRQTGPMAYANKFRFSTKYQDDESDYLYYGYRSYNPSTGRWLNSDPLAETSVFRFLANAADYQLRLHLESRKFDFSRDIYSFVRNQPLTLVDIDGSRDTPGGEVVINPENRRNPPDGMKLIKVKKCNIRILYGHNWEGEDKWKLGGFQHVWNIVAASDSQPSGCAYAAVLSCNAYNVPNEIPLPGYTPFRGVLPIKDRTADDDLVSEMVKAQKAAREAAVKCCKARCGCKKIEISYESYGLSIGEKMTFPTLRDETIQCPKGKKQK